jgi:hypothetical protein
MWCFVCLVTGHEPANRADVYVQGTSVCRDHLFALREANQQFNTPPPAPVQQGLDLDNFDMADLDRKLALLRRYMKKKDS